MDNSLSQMSSQKFTERPASMGIARRELPVAQTLLLRIGLAIDIDIDVCVVLCCALLGIHSRQNPTRQDVEKECA